jgi:hypothetical protein
MLRILLYVAALIALFAGAIMYGGNAIGAWDPLPPAPTPPPAVKVSHTKPKDQDKEKSGSGNQSTPAAAKLTPAQKLWVKKTNTLCRESKSQVQAVLAHGNTATTAGVLALFAQLKKVNAELNDRFLAIAVPVGYKKDVAHLRALFAREERYFASMQRALEQRDTKTFYALNDRLTQIALEETDVLDALGAYGCDITLSSVFD